MTWRDPPPDEPCTVWDILAGVLIVFAIAGVALAAWYFLMMMHEAQKGLSP